jgi:hypothetical protein
MAQMLSYQSVAGQVGEHCSSLRRVESYMISVVVLAKDLYSFSVLDLAIVGCFLDDQDTKVELM